MEINDYIKSPIIVAITGASGAIYGFRTVHFLLENNYKIELVISDSAYKVIFDELNLNLSKILHEVKEQVLSYLKITYEKSYLVNLWDFNDISASISSGSYKSSGMIIIPASMGTISSISHGISNNLITRAADVCLKERRKLVVVPREMPFNTIHIENLYKLSQCGAIVAPASPAFYNKPTRLSDSVDFVVGKVLDLFGIEHSLFKRWSKGVAEIPLYNVKRG